MSQSGYTPILIYGSSTASNVPLAANLTTSASGVELAINAADGKLFYKDSGGVVQVLATKAGAFGTVTSVAASVPSFLSIAGSPITSSGTLAITLSGTALPTTSGGTGLTSFTANGVVYASSSSVLTSGSALTFDGTKLSLPTVLAIKGAQNSNTARIAMTRTDQSWSINNETDLRFYGQNTDTETPSSIAHSMGNTGTFVWNNANTATEQMRLTSTGLGIGTSSPLAKLHVRGATNGNLLVRGGASAASGLTGTALSSVNDAASATVSLNFEGSDFNFVENNAVVAKLDSSGNLGLGVTPSAWDASGSGGPVLQIKRGLLFGADTETRLIHNAYYGTGDFRYIATGVASTNYQQQSGAHRWYTAPSGTAGNAISFTQAMTLDASGNLGIGTSSPGAKLTVAAAEAIRMANAAPYLSFYNGAQTTRFGYIQHNGTNISLVNEQAGSLEVYTNNTLRATLDSSGNLGLGVTPSAWNSGYKVLQTSWSALASDVAINGGTSLFTNARVGTASASDWRYLNTAAATRYLQQDGLHAWFNAPSGTAGDAISFTQAMTLDASGNWVVGRTSIIGGVRAESSKNANANYSTTFTTGTSSAQLVLTDLSATATYATPAATLVFGAGDSGGAWSTISGVRESSQNSAITFGTALGSGNPVERARIDSSGNLLINTATSVGGAARIGVLFAGNAANGINIQDSTTTSGAVFQQFSNSSGTQIGYIGRVTTTNSVVYSTTSDYRLKTVIGPVSGAGARIDALKPVDYQWKDGNQHARGFLAHEFQEVYANSVAGTKDAVNADGKPVYQGMQASTSEVIADLVAEIQSLRQRLAAAGIA